MKFIDEAIIKVEAGNGGHGCLSFRREKCVPHGGPNGGDVYLQGCGQLNTLVNFYYQRNYKAPNGQSGMGSNCTGKRGADLTINVPLGTMVFDVATNELIGDINTLDKPMLIAKGGWHGLGNTRFKSSINRAPTKTTLGTLGENRHLRLELRVLADVGLLGLPNAGKSSLIRAVSSAKPVVADYPFTTLHPHLGVVSVSKIKSFIIADIPGLIEGAARGTGLGHRFLKHLSRTYILLHIIDILPIDGSDPVIGAQTIMDELALYDIQLYNKPRWLVINKIDKFSLEFGALESTVNSIVERLQWQGRVFTISALTGEGTQELCHALMHFIDDEN